MDQGPQVDGHGHDKKREEEGRFPTFRTTFIHCQGFILHLILFNCMFLKYKSVISSFHSYKLIKRGTKIGKVPKCCENFIKIYNFILGHWFKHKYSYTNTQVTNHPFEIKNETIKSTYHIMYMVLCITVP